MPKGNKSNNRLLLDTWRSFFLVEREREKRREEKRREEKRREEKMR